MPDSIHIRPLDVISEVEIQALSDVLIDCVEGGGLCDTTFFYRALK